MIIPDKTDTKVIVNSSSESFKKYLYKAIDATGATLAFDAIGGGELAGDILAAMEAVGSKEATGFNTYGSVDNKQVPILSEEGLWRARFFTDPA